MKTKLALSLLAGITLVASSALAVKVGAPAPTFSVQGADGATHKLEDYKGKFVVLEWHNKDCPFVKKHYKTGNMQKLQKKWTNAKWTDKTGVERQVAWLEVISSAPGKEGYATAKQALADKTATDASPTAILLDNKSVIAHDYDAKTTPQMIIINPEGKIAYNGAIDDKATTDKEDVATAKNYVDLALTEVSTGKEISTASTAPYGCGVKF